MSVAGEYCVNRSRQSNGMHEVHRIIQTCPDLPEPSDWVLLGWQPDGYAALSAARDEFSRVVGCRHCVTKCSTRIHQRMVNRTNNGYPPWIKI